MLQIIVRAGKAIDAVGREMNWLNALAIKKMNVLAKLAETSVTPIFQSDEV